MMNYNKHAWKGLEGTKSDGLITQSSWYKQILTPISFTHNGIAYAVVHCLACFDLQGNGFCSQANGVFQSWMFTKYQAVLRCLAHQNKPDNGQWNRVSHPVFRE